MREPALRQHAVLSTDMLAGAATPQANLLADVAGGAARIALVHGESGERYAGSTTRAVTLAADDDGYVLSGQKLLALDAPSATHLIVSASLADKGLTPVLVEAGSPGIGAEDYPLLDGSRASDLRFDGVRVGADAVLATGTKAADLLAEALDLAALARTGSGPGGSTPISLPSCIASIAGKTLS